MRIISGNFKNKKILEPNDIKTRPLKDLVKESIFNILHHTNKFEISLVDFYENKFGTRLYIDEEKKL